ncbi:probable G-protein coupled receptor No9 isoform X3 [Vespa velutina]|uniref:probable G-protein coupled receptor No9 isoform X3 n=1 Tax=Vespa velutina TaxID=202808 RepID=UPI001FB436F8|nr:probable G-protein coupled receptor No9 isoform X3 [Vespa velutina]
MSTFLIFNRLRIIQPQFRSKSWTSVLEIHRTSKVVGNTLVIAAVITTRRLRSVTNCFVSSLAAADLLVGLAVMPPAVLLQLNGGSWELGEILCDSWVSLDILLCTASILSLCAISIDRYLAVTQPLIYSRRRRSKRLAGLMIVAVWILAGAITSPPLLGCFPRATNRDSKKCSYNMDSSYVIFSACGSFFLPMLVMLYVYGRISCVIASRHRNLETSDSEKTRRQTRNAPIERTKSMKIRRLECTVDSDTCERTSNEGETTSSCKKVGIIRGHQQSCINRVAKETKTAGTLAVVVGGFVACWLPFFTLYLATPFVPMEPPDILMPALTWLEKIVRRTSATLVRRRKYFFLKYDKNFSHYVASAGNNFIGELLPFKEQYIFNDRFVPLNDTPPFFSPE